MTTRPTLTLEHSRTAESLAGPVTILGNGSKVEVSERKKRKKKRERGEGKIKR
jgi:hypothetical protein